MADKKISYAEAVLMVLICIFADALEGFFSLIGLVPFLFPISLFFNWAINFTTLAIISFWLIIKGERPTWFFAGGLTEFIPFINILPLKTVTCIITIIIINRGPAALKKISHPTKK